MFASLVVFFVVFSVYYSALFDDVPGGDAGELLAQACSFGVAHPPGYPLLTALQALLFRVINNVDIYSPAFLGNCLSAFCAALSAAFLFSSTKNIIVRDCHMHNLQSSALGFLPSAVSFWAAAFFAFSPLVMLYALSAEVFSLNNLLCAMLIWTFTKHGHR